MPGLITESALYSSKLEGRVTLTLSSGFSHKLSHWQFPYCNLVLVLTPARTKSSSIDSQLYVKKNSHVSSIANKDLNIAQRKGVPHQISGCPPSPVPPLPLHHFLVALGYRSQ